ncbi:hypothetical protein [Paraburkholderia solisilvae]|uniref:Uncharacterized protein n=1 Tax=Paraburkholderia solisilvae TaxID=624376 RepID=A0A6J5DDX4_9BURK|nr:hypothetical protein [Paraburkholderia solisilvae]CAB3751627.1 hypothetical protein LMG29739_01340 [Paraburkholderia solisilvae]
MARYDRYRFRAWQAKGQDEGKTLFDGKMNGDDNWPPGNPTDTNPQHYKESTDTGAA